MDLQLKRIRESRGIKQSEMAERLSSLWGKKSKSAHTDHGNARK